tara:strand:+ start:45 stop:914 length:870 start_codon:yes stop_codon:yes gene_type:complete
MPRKITSGTVGRSILGDIFTQDNSLKSVVVDANVILEPNGTGVVESKSAVLIANEKELRLGDSGSNYAGIKSPATVASSYSLTLPDTDGSADQTLVTDGSGVLSWSAISVSVANRTSADNSTYYLAMIDAASATSGVEDTLSFSDSSRLEFVPNPGKLTVNQIAVQATTASSTTSSGALVVGGGLGVGGQVTATTIVETSSITLKENINPIQNALDVITQLKGVTYDRKDNLEHEAGLIAEWTDTVVPELVAKDEHGNATGIKYSKLTAYLIEAVKTLKDELDSIKSNK